MKCLNQWGNYHRKKAEYIKKFKRLKWEKNKRTCSSRAERRMLKEKCGKKRQNWANNDKSKMSVTMVRMLHSASTIFFFSKFQLIIQHTLFRSINTIRRETAIFATPVNRGVFGLHFTCCQKLPYQVAIPKDHNGLRMSIECILMTL